MTYIDHPKKPTADQANANVRIKFEAALLLQIAPFMASNDIRYYLNGIRIEAAKDKGKGIYLAATDGHRLAVIYDPEGAIVGGNGTGVIMRVTTGLLAACRKSRHLGLPCMVIAAGSRVSVAPDFGFEHSGYETYIMPGQPWVDGRFPDWANVLPVFADLKPGMNATINAKYIADFEKIVPRESRRYGAQLSFWQTHADGAMVVQVHQLPNFVGIVMPIRADSEESRRAALKPMFSAKPVVAPVATDWAAA